ncbi:MAG: hypothetical protein ACP5VQ_02470 [Phycisphaerae bacterium]
MTKPVSAPTGRREPASFFALGYGALPQRVEAMGCSFRFIKLFKHDFFAATGLYEKLETSGATSGISGTGAAVPALAVVKMQRTYPLFGLPVQWLGAIVARHEIAVFKALNGLAGVPLFMGAIGPTGYIHAFIPGNDLHPDFAPGVDFFNHLEALLTAIHARHIAYVDTNKRENILYGADAKPYLIDFQISFFCRHGAKDNLATRWILQRLQKEDWYHFYKHKTRLAPQICTAEDFQRANNRSWYIKLHRRIAQPIIHARRRFLARYKGTNPRSR